MKDDFLLKPLLLQRTAVLQELKNSVSVGEYFGLTLSDNAQHELVEARECALAATGRMEFGGGILPKLIAAFCDSPYVSNETWAATLAELQEAFYYFKGEAAERLTDDELIETMVSVFNGRAQGSAEYLIGTSLEELCRYERQGWDAHNAENCGDFF